MYPTENHYDHDHQHQNQDQHHQDQDQNQDQTSAIQLIHNSSEVKSKLSKPRVQTFKIKICHFPFKIDIYWKTLFDFMLITYNIKIGRAYISDPIGSI